MILIQVAANQKGIHLVTELIDAYGLDVVQAYMGFIQVVRLMIFFSIISMLPAFLVLALH